MLSTMKKIILMMFAAILLCSCGGLTHITTPNSVSLNQGNFKFVRVVSAETQASYILGIGGFSATATEDVVELLRQEANLAHNQALADIHIKKTTMVWFLGFYITRTLTATATVVEFSNDKSISSLNYGETENHNLIKGQGAVSIVEEQEKITENHSKLTDVVKSHVDYTRESVVARLTEINESLQSGRLQDLESVISEIEGIKKWYNGHTSIYLEVEKGLRDVNRHLKVRR